MRIDLACWGIAFLASLAITGHSSSDKILVPVDKTDNGSWAKSCENLKPIPSANDGSLGAICIGKDDKRYELVYRSISRKCESTSVSAKPEDYRHFLCDEKFELMIRPEKKN